MPSLAAEKPPLGDLQTALIPLISRSAAACVAVYQAPLSPDANAAVDQLNGWASQQPGVPLPLQLGCGTILEVDPPQRRLTILTLASLATPNATTVIRFPEGTTLAARILASDPVSNLAVVEVTVPELFDFTDVRRLAVGSMHREPAGTLIVALGDPLAITREHAAAAKLGIISRWGRDIGSVVSAPFPAPPALPQFRIDTLPDPGVGGGPIVDLHGTMIGVSLNDPASVQGQGTAAIPLTPAFLQIVTGLQAGYEIEYGFLGITVVPAPAEALLHIPEQHRQGGGVLVTYVPPPSPSATAELHAGDIITEANGHPVRNQAALDAIAGLQPPGTEIELSTFRPNSATPRNIKVKLAKHPVESKSRVVTAPRQPLWRGVRVGFPAPLIVTTGGPLTLLFLDGVTVTDVVADSAAAIAGIKSGDQIIKVGEQPIDSPQAFYDAVASWSASAPLTLVGRGEVVIPEPEADAPNR
ncbi:PDZ domain-containing protein [Planctomicrobium piriforme]|uniref:PDZ domain-containing protein n=1 Tax=Planctomicrobium piriforme TaxID=1576369 RepID=UPI001C318FD3|nr:PDZ domain-containing protein [Planctomicrobium piriforme]